jgi:hypothetical protein
MPIDSMVIGLAGNAFAQTDNASITTNDTTTKGTASAIDDDVIKSISSVYLLKLNIKPKHKRRKQKKLSFKLGYLDADLLL